VEVIVVDDGSTDRSVEALKAFGSRIRVLEGGHRGGNHARNLALQQAVATGCNSSTPTTTSPEKISDQLAAAGDEDVIFSPVWFEQDGQRTASAVDPARTRSALAERGDAANRRLSLGKSSIAKIDGGTKPRRLPGIRTLRPRDPCRPCASLAEKPGAVYRVWSGATLCRRIPRRSSKCARNSTGNSSRGCGAKGNTRRKAKLHLAAAPVLRWRAPLQRRICRRRALPSRTQRKKA